MRTAAIIQPSFLPWRGYFHIVADCDDFIFFDDVQFDRRGWRNRNQIKGPDGLQWITVPVFKKGKYDQLILETEINNETPWAKKLLTAIRCAYGKAPYFGEYFPWLEETLSAEWKNVSELDIRLTEDIAGLLGLKTRFHRSSRLGVPTGIGKVARLVELCKAVGARKYVSGPSAQDYIGDSTEFRDAGIELEYASYRFDPYPQLFGGFEGAVSVIDLLFNCGPRAPEHLRKVEFSCGLEVDEAMARAEGLAFARAMEL